MTKTRIKRNEPVSSQEWEDLASTTPEMVQVGEDHGTHTWGVRTTDITTRVEDGTVVFEGTSLDSTAPLLGALADALGGSVQR